MKKNESAATAGTADATTIFDAIVIGGSYAGLSAALQLARARRRILVVDAGRRRNRFAGDSHGFLTRDGQPAAAIAAEGRANVAAYPNVQWHDGLAVAARADTRTGTDDDSNDGNRDDGDSAHGADASTRFTVALDNGSTVHARRLVLATGVRDELPPIPGLAERWGKSVFHCPYCHGYELDEGRIGVLAGGPLAVHQAQMLPHWGQVTLFTNELCPLDEAQRADLQARGVTIEPARVARIEDAATVVLADGRRLPMDGLFTYGRLHMASPIAEQLGCAFDDGPLGRYIRTDEGRQTTVTGVFAGGDAVRAASNVPISVADGAIAGAGAHRSLIFGLSPAQLAAR